MERKSQPRARITDRVLEHVATEYSAELQRIVGPGKTRVLVETTIPVLAGNVFGLHLGEHGLKAIGEVHDAVANHYFLECELTIGEARIRELDTCDDCSRLIKAVHPNHERSIPRDVEAGALSVGKGKKAYAEAILSDTLGKIHVPEVWADVGGCKGINLGHFDTGQPVLSDNRFFDGYYPNQPSPPDPRKVTRIVLGKSFVPGASPQDGHGHGTKTLAIAASIGWAPDGQGYKGILYQASLYCFKVLSDQGSGLDSWILNSVIDARNYPLDVCTMSLGGPAIMQALEDAININVTRYGQVWCVATGNDGKFDPNNPHVYACDRSLASPGSAREAFACGASDAGNEGGQPEASQSWSSRPPSKDNRQSPDPPRGTLEPIANATCQFYLLGPGVGISTRPGENTASGTSFATPHIAGVSAQLVYGVVIKQGRSALRRSYPLVKMIREAILRNADELGYWTGGAQHWTQKEAYCIEGWGRVNAKRAFDAIIGGPPPPPPPTRKGKPSMSPIKTVIILPSGPPHDQAEDTSLDVVSDSPEYVGGDQVTIQATLKFQSDSAPMVGRSITIMFAGAGNAKPGVTNQNGQAVASWNAPDNLTARPIQVEYSAKFDGDA